MKKYLLLLSVLAAAIAYWLWAQVGYLPLPEPLPMSKGSMNWLVVYPGPGIVVDMAINARAREFSDFARYEKELTALFLAARTAEDR